MAKDEQPLSPEEKLLKVIRNGEKAAPPAAAAAEPSTPALKPAAPAVTPVAVGTDTASRKQKPAPAAAAVGTDTEARKQKLTIKPEQPAGAASGDAAAKPPIAATAAEATTSQPAAAHAGRKRTFRRFGIATVNRFLAAAIVVIVAFAGFEIWSSVMAMQLPEPLQANPVLPQDGSHASDLPPLAELLKSIESRPIVQSAETGSEPSPDPDKSKEPVKGWAQDLKESLKLKGFAGNEAVLVDSKNKDKMHFLQAGQKVTFHGQEVTLEKIESDSVTFTDGKDRLTIK